MCHTLIFVKNKKKYFINSFYLFLGIFLTLPTTQTIKVIGLFLFFELALKKWAMIMYFNPMTILSKAFFGRGGAKRIDSDPQPLQG